MDPRKYIPTADNIGIGAESGYSPKIDFLSQRHTMLPVELLHVIAGVDTKAYRSMLALPPFARSLDPSTVTDFMISFGFGIEITRERITWTRDGVEHRNGGPAMIQSDGAQFWCQYGDFHRDDGPAAIFPGGGREWYQHGIQHRDDGPAVIFSDGTQYWYRGGKLHRDDGPAVIYSNGTQCWYRSGIRHRDDGPAITRPNGAQCWYRGGKRVWPEN
jgi:hypothetical protein